MIRRYLRSAGAALLAVLAAACGQGGEPPPSSATPAVVTGSASKGPLQGATVEFYRINAATGAATTFVTSVVTDSAGNFVVTGLPGELILVKTSGGSYVDESDAETNPSLRRRITFAAGERLMAILPAGQTTLAITPYSMALYQKALAQAGGSNFANVYAAVRTQATAAFGFDPITTIPADPITGAGGSQHYAMLLGAAAVAINASATTAGHLPAFADVMAFIDDFADGRLDAQSLPDAIRRFRNNNIGVYGGESEPAVNEDALSAPAPVPNSAPVGIPTIIGTPTEDLTLTADASGITDADGLGTFSYQWHRSGTPIVGATGTSYVLADADVGTTITLTASYTDGGSAAESATSNGAGPVANVNDVPAGTPTISGTPTQNQTLAAVTSGITDTDGLGTFSYRWQRGGSPIGAATASTYVLVQADVGQSITVTVSYTDGHGTVETLTSAGVGPVANFNDPPVINSTASPTATEDTVYTYNATVTDVDGPSAAWSLAGTNTCLGALINATTGAYTFTPAGPAPPASCVVGVQVTDGGTPVTQSTTVTITAVNDAPLINSTASTTATEDTLYTYNATVSDADGPAPSWSLGAGHTCGGTLSPTSGAFSFTPGGPAPPASCIVEVAVTDGGTPVSQSTTVTISAVNDAPTISDGPSGSILEDSNTGSLDYTIGDGETSSTALTFAATSSNASLVPNVEPTNISYADDGDGNGAFRDLTVTPAADQYGSAFITVTVTDGDGATATDTFTLTVDPVSDAPSAQTFGIQTDPDVAYVFGTAEFNFADAVDTNGDGSDEDFFDAVILTSLPPDGTLLLNDGAVDNPITALPAPPISTTDISLGRFKFLPDSGESGLPYTSFTFQVQDTGNMANGGVIASIAYVLNVDVLPAAAPPESLLPYVTASGELKLLDPLDPTNPVLIETGLPAVGFKGRTLLRADVTAGVASNIRPARFIYIKDDGGVRKVWKVNLEPAQSRTPVQVSSITDACGVNGSAEDFANPDNTILRVDTAGTDGICQSSDDFTTAEAYLVPLTTAAAAPGEPIGLGQCCGIAGIADGSGALTGVLSTEDDGSGSSFSLVRRNVGALGTPVAVDTLQISGTGQIYAHRVRGLGQQHIYLRARRSIDSTYKLLRFNSAGGALTELYDYGVSDAANLPDLFDDSAYDGADLFFTSADGGALLRLSHGATGPGQATQLVALSAGNKIESMEQAADRIVYQVFGPSGGVFAVPKVGGAAAALAPNDAAPTVASLAATNGGRVFISLVTGATPDFVARAVDADGANVSDVTDAQWAGESYQRTCDFNVNCEDNIAAQAVFLRHGAAGNLADLELVDPATGAGTGNFLPQIINVAEGQAVFAFGFGRFAQLTFFSVAGNTDIWLADTSTLAIAPVSVDAGGDDYWVFDEGPHDDGSSMDADGDGLTDTQEAGLGTDPNRPDTDNDGLGDRDEVDNDGDPASYTPGVDTNPTNPDTDADGLQDGAESGFTDATQPDTDGDGVGDGLEVNVGSDPVGTINEVIYANAACGAGCDGLTWTSGFASQAAVLAAIDANGGGGINAANTLYVLYAPGTYGALALTDTPRGHIVLAGSLGAGVYAPAFPPTSTFDAANTGPALRLANVQPIVAEGLAFTGGNNAQGGGVMLDVMSTGVQLSLRRVRIHNNTAEQGAGLALLAQPASSDDYVEIVDSIIEDNLASSSTQAAAGGGIYMTEGSLTLTRAKLANNQASGIGRAAQGGGLHVAAAGLGVYVEDSEFRGNKAFGDVGQPGSGGGIHLAGAAFLDFYMEFSRVVRNETHGAVGVTSGGAGLYAEGNTRALAVVSMFADNNAQNGPGGGINMVNVPDFGVEHSQFLSNSAKRPGGGLHVHVPASGLAHAFNNLFVGNVSTDPDADGGAIEIENIQGPVGSLKLESNTVAYNQLTGNGGAAGGGVSVQSANAADTFRNNIAWFNDNATVNDPFTSVQAGDDVFFDAPLDASGNNVNESFVGNSVQADPLLQLGFYLDPSSSSVDAGDDTAANVFFSAFASPFTTDPSGSADAGVVDIGFHHVAGKPAAGPVTGASAFAVPSTAGCPSATVHVTLATADGPLGAGHLVVADAIAGGSGSLSGLTTLDPLASGTSVLAIDQGDGNYRLGLSGGSGSYTFDVYVDGAGPFPASFACF